MPPAAENFGSLLPGAIVHDNRMLALRGSHCSGMEECRLRDPPQAENPASQDSFLHNFQVPGIIELRIIGKIMLELEIIPNGAACCKRERCEAAVF